MKVRNNSNQSPADLQMIIIRLLLPRLIALSLLVIGITSKQYEFYFLLLSGGILGFYYGWFNDLIWRPNGKLEKSLPYRVHQIWIHVICGVVGSIALYLLLGGIDVTDRLATLERLNLSAFVLFIISILGYTGLLPRILWFFTYAQQKIR